MKKFLPVFLFLLGVVVLVGVYFLVIKGKKEEPTTEEETALVETPLEKRPIASLTPSSDGHWLKLLIEKIVIDAASLDYELLYKLPDGRTQGVPGTIKLTGQKEIERDLLLGSESSGKFRYDEGVERGTLTLRFRNDTGKLIAKFSTEFHLQSETNELTSTDGVFKYTLDKSSKAFFVTMETFGVPDDPPGEVIDGPYGVFSSSSTVLPGEMGLGGGAPYLWDGTEWIKLEEFQSPAVGIFIVTSGSGS
ncbi:hypothetical protein IID22_03760 [Patescibacteria group bacterium]|nr:hypothetical protein [Patescibacteria group bacterium]